MDIVFQAKAVKLIRQLIDKSVSTTPVIPFIAQKPKSSGICEQPYFQRVVPESEGVSSKYLFDFLKELDENKGLDMHSIMIMRNGRVLSEGSFGAYKKSVWHITYSMCKSITGLAIGLLIDEGKLSLDDKLVDIFSKNANIITTTLQKNITVKSLLTMSTGVVFNEAGSVTETDWVQGFLESAVRFEAGKGFSYNSMNSYMLSAIVCEKSGRSLREYLDEKLFIPMGITDLFWEKCPKGIEKGGWGLYIKLEDVAKLGQLVLQNGVWNGVQLISKEYISAASTKQNTAQDNIGNFDYGFQMWTGRGQNSFLFNGMFGQNLIAFRDTGIIVASNAGNDEFFQVSDFFTTVEKYFGKDYAPCDKLPRRFADCRRLRELEARLGRDKKKGFFERNKICKLAQELDGRVYTFSHDDTAGVGIMPLYLQAAQNNHTKGLDKMAFYYKDKRLIVDVTESKLTNSFEIGLFEPKYNDVCYDGEPYKVGLLGEFCIDEDGLEVLKLRFSFIETANSRIVKLFFLPNGDVKAEFMEKPGKDYLMLALDCTVKDIKNVGFLEPLVDKLDSDFIDYKISAMLEPSAIGRLKK